MSTEYKIYELVFLPDGLYHACFLHHTSAERYTKIGVFLNPGFQQSQVTVDLLIGIIPDSTGIIYHKVSLCFLVNDLVSCFSEHTGQFLTVPRIHLTAKGHNRTFKPALQSLIFAFYNLLYKVNILHLSCLFFNITHIIPFSVIILSINTSQGLAHISSTIWNSKARAILSIPSKRARNLS